MGGYKLFAVEASTWTFLLQARRTDALERKGCKDNLLQDAMFLSRDLVLLSLSASVCVCLPSAGADERRIIHTSNLVNHSLQK